VGALSGPKIVIYQSERTLGLREMSNLASISSSETVQPQGTVELTLRHNGVENKIIGSPDGVVRELLAYFSKVYPSLEITSKLVLSVDNSEFLQSCTGALAASPEGLAILRETSQLKDKELMLLHLSGSKLMHLLSRKETDTVSLDELTRATGKTTGTVAGRLSELTNEQLVERVRKGSYRLTTMGARTVVKTIMPKLATYPER
jgi:DNA-binding transcriptional ArsR family regulator